MPFAKRPGLVRACSSILKYCRDHAATGSDPLGDDRVVGNVFFSSNDAVSAGKRGWRRDREIFALRVRMTRRVEDLGLLRPGEVPMY